MRVVSASWWRARTLSRAAAAWLQMIASISMSASEKRSSVRRWLMLSTPRMRLRSCRGKEIDETMSGWRNRGENMEPCWSSLLSSTGLPRWNTQPAIWSPGCRRMDAIRAGSMPRLAAICRQPSTGSCSMTVIWLAAVCRSTAETRSSRISFSLVAEKNCSPSR